MALSCLLFYFVLWTLVFGIVLFLTDVLETTAVYKCATWINLICNLDIIFSWKKNFYVYFYFLCKLINVWGTSCKVKHLGWWNLPHRLNWWGLLTYADVRRQTSAALSTDLSNEVPVAQLTSQFSTHYILFLSVLLSVFLIVG